MNVLTKGQGGAILPMQGTNVQELKKIENVTNRVRSSGLAKRVAI